MLQNIYDRMATTIVEAIFNCRNIRHRGLTPEVRSTGFESWLCSAHRTYHADNGHTLGHISDWRLITKRISKAAYRWQASSHRDACMPDCREPKLVSAFLCRADPWQKLTCRLA